MRMCIASVDAHGRTLLTDQLMILHVISSGQIQRFGDLEDESVVASTPDSHVEATLKAIRNVHSQRRKLNEEVNLNLRLKVAENPNPRN